jgi:S1-C subfamily serine protease
MTTDRFHASFRLRIDRDTAWHRLTADEAGSDVPAHLWLPGFDSQVTVVDAAAPDRLRATKDDEPCVSIDGVREGTLAHRLGLTSGDLLVTLAGAPVASLDDLVTVLRVLDATTRPDAEWVRSGALMTTPSA